MAWNFDNWRQWTTQHGVVWRVAVAAGMIGSGALYWWQRDKPRYPTALDQAEIMAALTERYLAGYDADRGDGTLSTPYHWVTEFPTWNGTNIVWVPYTNTVGHYASVNFYNDRISRDITSWLLLSSQGTTYIDLWGTAETNSGVAKWARQPVTGTMNETVFAASNMLSSASWWMANGWPGWGTFYYLGSNQLYLATNILNEAGKVLSAMRWRAIKPDTSSQIESCYVRWYAQSDWETNWLEAVSAAYAELQTCTPYVQPAINPPWPDCTNRWPVYEHWIQLTVEEYGWGVDEYRATLEEMVKFKWREEDYFWPRVTNLVQAVHTLGYYATISDYSMPWGYTRGFACGDETGMSETNAMTFVMREVEPELAALPNGGGATGVVYRTNLFPYDGRMPLSAVTTGGNRLYKGWQRGQAALIADLAFQHLTNAPTFWGGSFGIRGP